MVLLLIRKKHEDTCAGLQLRDVRTLLAKFLHVSSVILCSRVRLRILLIRFRIRNRNGRGQLADEYFFSCMTQGTLRRRVNDVMKLAVRHSTALCPPFISSRHCKVSVFTSSVGRQGIHFLDASCCLKKTTPLKGSSECHVLF